MEVRELSRDLLENAMFKDVGRVSLLPDGDADTGICSQPPARGLAVSNLFGLTFFATVKGFSLIETKDLVELASQSKEALPSAFQKCISSVNLPDVRLLQLSKDETFLAVCAGCDARLYHVSVLLHHKDKTEPPPFQVHSVGETVRDFHWCPSENSKYIILSSKGTLSQGTFAKESNHIEDGVSAACWDQEGKHIAYTVDLQLNIASTDLVKVRLIDLPEVGEEDLATQVVDGLFWISSTSMLVSYVQTDEEEEVACPVFLIETSQGKLIEEGAQCTAVAMFGGFPVISPSIVPANTRPYLLADYLAPWKILIASCRRSTDEHIVLLGWTNETSVCYSFERDDWVPHLPPTDSMEDNAVAGLAIDLTSTAELQDPRNPGEKLPPGPIVLCRSLDNRLYLYHFVRFDRQQSITRPPCSLEDIKPLPQAVSPNKGTIQITGLENKTPSAPSSAPFSASRTVNEQRRIQEETMQKQAGPMLSQVQKQPTAFAGMQGGSSTFGASQKAPSSAPPSANTRAGSELAWVRPSGISDIEADFLAELDKVRRMGNEVDNFMLEKSIPTNRLLEKLERELSFLSGRCNELKHNLQERTQLVEELRDQSLQVDAWRIYVASLVEQATDNRYHDLWIHKKLQPEMDIKRRHVINADQALKRQITELEGQLHVLELSQRQYGHGRQYMNQPTSSPTSLYATVNAQLDAAERLCSRLSQLMELLNVPFSARASSSFISDKGLSTPPKPVISDYFSIRAPESTRRRRDSMDSWAGVETSKTTIKRATRAKSVDERQDFRKLKLSNSVGSSGSFATLKQHKLQQQATVVAPVPKATATAVPLVAPKEPMKVLSEASLASSALKDPSKPLLAGSASNFTASPFGSSKATAAGFLNFTTSNAAGGSSASFTTAASTITATSTITAAATSTITAASIFYPTSSAATSATSSFPPEPPVVPVAKVISASAEQSLPASTSSKSTLLCVVSPPAVSSSVQTEQNINSNSTPAPSTNGLQSPLHLKPASTSAFTQQSANVFSSHQIPASSSSAISSSLQQPSSTPTPIINLNSTPSSTDSGSSLSPSTSTNANAFQSLLQLKPASSSSSSQQSSNAQAHGSPFSSPLQRSNTTPSSTSSLFTSSSPFTPSAFPALNQVPPPPQVQEEDMDEEAGPEASGFSGFGGFNLGTSPVPSKPSGSPFGVTSTTQTTQASPFGTFSAPPGQLFRPSSFALPQASSPAPAANPFNQNAFAQSSPASGQTSGSSFGQPSKLGSALGAFGQTRQVGFGSAMAQAPASSGSGAFFPAATGGGFANVSTASGFGAFSQKQGFASFSSQSTNTPPSGDPRFTEMRK